MNTHSIAALCMLVVLGCASRTHAGAEAVAGGGVADGSLAPFVDQQAWHAHAPKLWKAFDDDGTYIDAVADVTGTTLKARVHVGQSSINQPFPLSGFATATWTDVMSIDNAELFAGIFQTGTAFAYFSPKAHGGLPQGGASGEFLARVYDNTFNNFDFELLYGGNTKLSVQFPLSAFNHGVNFKLELGTGASVNTSNATSTIDYFHTAILSDIFIGDAYGNPIPGIPVPHFVGLSAQEYSAVTTIPAPWATIMTTALSTLATTLSGAKPTAPKTFKPTATTTTWPTAKTTKSGGTTSARLSILILRGREHICARAKFGRCAYVLGGNYFSRSTKVRARHTLTLFFPLPMPAAATGFFFELQTLNRNSAIDRLAHVVDG